MTKQEKTEAAREAFYSTLKGAGLSTPQYIAICEAGMKWAVANYDAGADMAANIYKGIYGTATIDNPVNDKA